MDIRSAHDRRSSAIVVTVVLGRSRSLWDESIGRVTARGFRNGALIAARSVGITVVIVTFVFNGRAVFVDTLDLTGAFELGLIVGRRRRASATCGSAACSSRSA